MSSFVELEKEIEEAARQHLNNTFVKDADDLKTIPVFEQSQRGKEIDGEILKELTRS